MYSFALKIRFAWIITVSIGLLLSAGVVERAYAKQKLQTQSASPIRVNEIPIPKNLKCLDDSLEKKYSSLPECALLYTTHCPDKSNPDVCSKTLACPAITDPVYDDDGIFYPSPCWAERFGVRNYRSGWSPKLRAFVRDLWRTPKDYTALFPIVANHGAGSSDAERPLQNIDVPTPHIEFLFRDGDFGLGPLFRSMLWNNQTSFSAMDIHISDYGKHSTSIRTSYNLQRVTGTKKTLLVYVQFENWYPEAALLDFTQRLTDTMNAYFRKKQAAPHPLQYAITTVVIDPPEGVTKDSLIRPEGSLGQYFDKNDSARLYRAALKKIGSKEGDFETLVIAPILDVPPGGIYTGGFSPSSPQMPPVPSAPWRGERPAKIQKTSALPEASVQSSDRISLSNVTINSPGLTYQPGNRLDGIIALGHLRDRWYTLIHELEHGLGMDHDMLIEGPENIASSLLNGDIQPITIPEYTPTPYPENPCKKTEEMFEKGEAVSITLPDELRMRADEYLTGTTQHGKRCLSLDGTSEYLFDSDNDGIYELIFMGGAMNSPLQRALGWADLDGDGIAEAADENPYGGMKGRNIPKITFKSHIPLASFKSIGKKKIKNCQFEKIKLSTGDSGLIPLTCAEFDKQIAHIYNGLLYGWLKINKSFGTIFLPRVIPNALSFVK